MGSKSKSGRGGPSSSPRGRLPHRSAASEMTSQAEADLDRRLRALRAQFREGQDADRVLRFALRLSLEFFAAPAGCIAVWETDRDRVEIAFASPKEAVWDRDLLTALLRGDDIRPPQEQMFARIRRRGRIWGLLALRDDRRDFRSDARRAFSSIAAAASEIVTRIDEDRIREVRARIDRKIMEQIRAKDLFYQILHGIRSLTGYDHSAAILMCEPNLESLEVVAEQIAWRKGKSPRVGLKLPLSASLRELLGRRACYGFDRQDRSWVSWSGDEAAELAVLLDYNREPASHDFSAAESAMLCAPLATRDRVLGLLKVAARNARSFGFYEADLISGFLPQASVALQNSQRTESLEMQVISAERKHAMADLARGVSHDVNNALGAVIPLVQQLRDDIETGRFDAAVASADLREIERSIQVCRRIFGGMLSFARGAAGRNEGPVALRHEVDCTLAILRDGLERKGIELQIDIPQDLPPIRGVRADVEQLLLNLITNARDAMPQGGRLQICAAQQGGDVVLRVADTGCGIPAAHLAKIFEPFFTTKTTGNGLGLAICRSVVSELGGRIELDSRPGEGTTVRVRIPVANAGPP